jgi:Zn finger protein HypA/HybF involved in hydrogenase expression
LLAVFAKGQISGGKELAMNAHSSSMDNPPKCERCDRETKPTAIIFREQRYLCPACCEHLRKLPAIVVKYIERVLIGNVV